MSPDWLKIACLFCFQSFLKHKDARPLRDVLAANPNRFITLLLPGGPQTAVRPGSPSTSTLRLDLQFQAIKVASPHQTPEIFKVQVGCLENPASSLIVASFTDHKYYS